MKTAVKVITNTLAPEVKVRKVFELRNSSPNISELAKSWEEQSSTTLESHSQNRWTFRFDGSPVSNLASLKITLGLDADPAHYRNMTSLLSLTKVEEKLVVESHERIIFGLPTEQRAYKKLLEKRIQQFEQFLKSESIILSN